MIKNRQGISHLVFLIGILIPILIFATSADADYVGSLVNRIFVDPSSLDVVSDGYQAGDEVSFILETTPWQSDGKSLKGHAAWMTLYVPPGVEVISVEFTDATPLGSYIFRPAEDTDASYDGWGRRGAAGYTPTTGVTQLGEGYVNQMQQDTGIFYSTDPRTSLISAGLGPLEPTGIKAGPQLIYNQWDYDQILAFGVDGALSGNRGKGNTPLVGTGCTGPNGAGCTWAGTGSIVAGPQTYYTNDYNPACSPSASFEDDLTCTGPWQRIAYPNSKLGAGDPITPATDQGAILNTSVPTSAGFTVSSSSPLPPGTNTVRFVHGKRRVGELETARVTFRITDPVAFQNSFTNNTFCLDSVGGDTSDIAAKDNPFRYYEPQHQCNFLDPTAHLFKQARYVNNLPDTGAALSNDDVVSYSITFTNTSANTLHNITVTDVPEDWAGTASPYLSLLEPGDPACAWTDYDGDRPGLTYVAGSASSGTAEWTTLSALPPGESVTVFICGRVTGAPLYERAYNSGIVDYDHGTTHHTLRSTTTGTVTSSISGRVYIDADSSGNLSAGDSGAPGVTISLYIDNNSDGNLDGGDTLYDTTSTLTDGTYQFIGIPADDYIVVESDPPGWSSTGDADNPGGTCAAGNGCNTIGTITIASGTSSRSNNFFDYVPPSMRNTITGKVFADTDTDGIYDTGETGPLGVTVTLYSDTNSNGILDGGDIPIQTQNTSIGGDFQFILVTDGDFLMETSGLPSGATMTTDNLESASFTGLGNLDSGNYFGYIAPPGLSVTKIADQASAMPGDTITYTIEVRNITSTVQTGINVSDSLPSGTIYVSESTSATGTTDIGSSGSLDLTPSGDTYLEEKNPNNNYGSNNKLKIKTKNNDDKRPLLKWDLSSIPSGATITSATMSFFVTRDRGGVTVNIHRMSTDWTEGGADWNTYDGTSNWITSGGDYNGTPEGNFTPDKKNQYVTVDVTSLVQNWTSEAYPNYGVILISDSDKEVKIASSESTGREPVLNVSYTVPPTVETKTNQSTDPNPLADGTPPALVLPADGFVLLPGDSMTVTFTVTVDSPISPGITEILNEATATSYESVIPATGSANTLLPTLESYESDYTTIKDLFYRDPDGSGSGTDLIYSGGIRYGTSTAYDIAYYDSGGNLVYTDTSASSDAAGALKGVDPNTNDAVRYGTWTAVVIPDSFTPSPNLSSQLSDTNSITTDTFDVVTWSKVVFTDMNGTPVLGYDMSSGSNTAYITVYDRDENKDPALIEKVSLTVSDPNTGDSETVILYETGPDTGIFANDSSGSRFGLPLSTTSGGSPNDGTLYVTGGYNISASYTDSDDSADTATATVFIPTRVTLSGFRGYVEDGKVIIEWETDSETDTVGFHLERFNPASLRFERINRNILPGLITSPQGGVYRLTDPDARLGGHYRYRLVELEGSGKINLYGPFSVNLEGTGIASPSQEISHRSGIRGPGSSIDSKSDGKVTVTSFSDGTIIVGANTRGYKGKTASYKNRDGTTVVNLGGETPSGSVFSTEALNYKRLTHKKSRRIAGTRRVEAKKIRPFSLRDSLAKAIKIPVKAEGIYYISSEEISRNLGLPEPLVRKKIMARKFRLENAGKAAAYMPLPDGSGLYFYGKGISSIYTDTNIYYLKAGKGKTIRWVRKKTGRNARISTYREKIRYEVNMFPATGLFDDPEADYWLWDYLFAGQPGLDEKEFSMELTGPAGRGDVTVTITLMGSTEAAEGNDHHAVISINGIEAGSAVWKGRTRHIAEVSIDPGILREGTNIVTLRAIRDPGVPYSIFFLDSIEIEYERLFRSENDRLTFTAPEKGRATLTGFSTGDIIALDISNELRPRLVRPEIGAQTDGTFSVTINVLQGHRYFIASTSGVYTIENSVPDWPSHLKDNRGAEYLIITPPELAEAMKPLAAYRKGKGLSTMIIRTDDIYDEFNSGRRSPHAIREFLEWAYNEWQVRPLYVILAGEGSYDYRNYLGNSDSLVPPLMIATSKGLFPSDTILGDIDRDGRPEIAVGRIPVISSNEVIEVLNKIKAYESSTLPSVTALSDNPDAGGDFPAGSTQVHSPLSGIMNVQSISLAEMNLSEARSLLFDALKQGTGQINYLGHAGLTQVADEGLLKASDIPGLQSSYPPLFVGLTCVMGNFAIPGFDSLGEVLAIEPSGASVVWTATGMSMNEDAVSLGEQFYRSLYLEGISTLGKGILRSYSSYMDRGGNPEMVWIYTLIGDPAIVIPR